VKWVLQDNGHYLSDCGEYQIMRFDKPSDDDMTVIRVYHPKSDLGVTYGLDNSKIKKDEDLLSIPYVIDVVENRCIEAIKLHESGL
jgi:hypothetical protein